ncbi:MAG: manganese efflux pump [Angelakisella sp.]|nr:manganese efflux pump [Angelakisella sp.]
MMWIIRLLLLVLALCLDSFMAALSLSCDQIRVPLTSAVVISGVSAGFLAAAMGVGQLAQPFLPPAAAAAAGCILLCALGLARLLDNAIKRLIRKSHEGWADLHFRFLSFQCILHIYADSSAADADRSKAITPMEALPLAIALSLDSLAAGLGVGLGGSATFLAAGIALALCMGTISVVAGCKLGRYFCGKIDLGWLGGIMLIFLGISKLL